MICQSKYGTLSYKLQVSNKLIFRIFISCLAWWKGSGRQSLEPLLVTTELLLVEVEGEQEESSRQLNTLGWVLATLSSNVRWDDCQCEHRKESWHNAEMTSSEEDLSEQIVPTHLRTPHHWLQRRWWGCYFRLLRHSEYPELDTAELNREFKIL